MTWNGRGDEETGEAGAGLCRKGRKKRKFLQGAGGAEGGLGMKRTLNMRVESGTSEVDAA